MVPPGAASLGPSYTGRGARPILTVRAGHHKPDFVSPIYRRVVAPSISDAAQVRHTGAMTTIAAAFTTCPAPWGVLHVAATSAGIVAVGLDEETPSFVDDLARRLHGTVLPAEDADVPAEWRVTLAAATRQIGEFFAGERRTFDVPIDLRVSDWDRLVLTGAARLGYGETAGYGDLARYIGRPGAAQAVGGAMGRNPVAILIPCHRVIGANRTLGGYGGSTFADRRAGLAIKRTLLALEGTTLRD